MLQIGMQEDLHRPQAWPKLDGPVGLCLFGVVVGIDVQVVVAFRESAGPVPRQRLLVVTGPGVDGRCAGVGRTLEGGIEEGRANAARW
jgi:hypothetical protein